MAEKWSTIMQDEAYKSLPAEQQQQLKQRYFDNVISRDESFTGLPETQKAEISERFFNQGQTVPPQPSVQQNTSGFDIQQNLSDANGYGYGNETSKPPIEPRTSLSFDSIGKLITNENELKRLSRINPSYLGRQEDRAKHWEKVRQLESENNSVLSSQDPNKIAFAKDIYKKVNPTWFREYGGQTAGGVAGGTAGAALGAKVGAGVSTFLGLVPPASAVPEELVTVPLGAALGAYIGGGLGKTMQEKSYGEPVTPEDFNNAGSQEAKAELYGRYLGMGLKKALKMAAGRKLNPNVTQETIDKVENAGAVVPLPNKSTSWRSVIANSIAKTGGPGTVYNVDLKNKKVLLNLVRSTSKEMSQAVENGVTNATDQEAAEGIFDLFKRGMNVGGQGKWVQAFDELVDPMYQKLDDMTGNVVEKVPVLSKVPSTLLDETGKPLTKDVTNIVTKITPKVGVSTKNIVSLANDYLQQDLRSPFLTPDAKSWLTKIATLPDSVGFMDMKSTRTTLNGIASKLTKDADQSQIIFSKFANEIKNAMTDPTTAKGLTQEALDLKQKADTLFFKGSDIMDNLFPKQMVADLKDLSKGTVDRILPSTEPKMAAKVRDTLINTLDGKPSDYGKKMWDKLRYAKLNNIIESCIEYHEPSGTWAFNSNKYAQALYGQEGIGKDMLKVLFPDTGDLKRIGQNLEMAASITSKYPSVAPVLLMRSAQGGAAIMSYKEFKDGNFVGATAYGTLAMSPYLIARLATSKQGSKLLYSGFNSRPGTTEMSSAIARLIKYTSAMYEEDEKSEQQYIDRMSKYENSTKSPVKGVAFMGGPAGVE